MAAHPQLADREIDATAPEIAAAVLEHPLAAKFGWDTIWALMATAGGDPSIRPADARQVLRLALAAIDAAEIQISLEVVP